MSRKKWVSALKKIFIEAFKSALVKVISAAILVILGALIFFWNPILAGIVWVWNFIWTSHPLPGWVLIILFLLAVVGISSLALRIYKKLTYRSYTEDNILGVKWRWSWKGKVVSGLRCYCPRCDVELSDKYEEPHIMVYRPGSKVYFVCENCGRDKDLLTGQIDIYNPIDAARRVIESRARNRLFPRTTKQTRMQEKIPGQEPGTGAPA
jgi:hypothetical protein